MHAEKISSVTRAVACRCVGISTPAPGAKQPVTKQLLVEAAAVRLLAHFEAWPIGQQPSPAWRHTRW